MDHDLFQHAFIRFFCKGCERLLGGDDDLVNAQVAGTSCVDRSGPSARTYVCSYRLEDFGLELGHAHTFGDKVPSEIWKGVFGCHRTFFQENARSFGQVHAIARKCKWCRRKRSFLSSPPALPHIKDLGGTKTHDKAFAVLGGFWHSAA